MISKRFDRIARVVLIATVFFGVASTSNAAETVHGPYTSICEPIDKAKSNAMRPSYSKMEKAARCKNYTYKEDKPDCKECSKGGHLCRGVAIVSCP